MSHAFKVTKEEYCHEAIQKVGRLLFAGGVHFVIMLTIAELIPWR